MHCTAVEYIWDFLGIPLPQKYANVSYVLSK